MRPIAAVARAVRAVGVGFARAVVFAVAALLVPAASVGITFVGRLWGAAPWSWVNPWSWFALLIIIGVLALVLARPLGTLFRRLVARWCGVVIEDGYRRPAPITRMATGYWWNGHSYERTRRDAELDQRMRRGLKDPAYWRDVRWLAIAAITVGPVCAVPPATLIGTAIAFTQPSVITVVAGVLLVLIAMITAPYAWRIVGPVAGRWLRLSDRAQLAQRVRELTEQRADATAAQAAEIRRIERDLHDGAQARLVAVGLSLATAERLMADDPERAAALLREARQGTSTSLAELRELVRGVNPPVLVERGLVDAVRALALDSSLDVRVDSPDRLRLGAPIESALYFSVAELLANAAKHAPSAHVRVRIEEDGDDVIIEVADDGPGGAALLPGGGLDGIQRRLGVFDGTLTVSSPSGGPTRARIAVPCA